MKETEDNRESKNVEKYGQVIGQYLDDHFVSGEYDNADNDKKIDLLKGLFKAVSLTQAYRIFGEEKQKEIGENKERVDKFVETKGFESFANSIIKSGLEGADFQNDPVIESMGPLTDILRTVAEPNDKTLSAYTRAGLIRINSYCEAKKRNKLEAGEKAEEKGLGNNEKTVIENTYQEAMDKFNRKRASVFTQESPEHKELRQAAEKMQEMRSLARSRAGAGLAEQLSQSLDAKEKMELAKNWLKNAHALRDIADDYIEKKGVAVSPAGRSRLAGAKKLKRIAKSEIDQCRKTIEDMGGDPSLDSVYEEIKKDMVKEAMNTLKSMKSVKNPTTEQSEKIFDAVHTLLGAASSDKAMSEGKDPREANVIRAVKHNKRVFNINQTVANYVGSNSVEKILSDLTTPNSPEPNLKQFVGSVKGHYRQIFTSMDKSLNTDVRAKTPKPENYVKPAAPKGFTM